jgi:hypothetical protein
MKPKTYEYQDQFIFKDKIQSSFHQFPSSSDLYEEISKLKKEIERKNKIISVYEIDLHKLQLQNLKNNMNVYQNIQIQLNNLKQLISETKRFFINEFFSLKNYYESIILTMFTKTKEIIKTQTEQLKFQDNLDEQTSQKNQNLFPNQKQSPYLNIYKNQLLNQEKYSFLVNPHRDKISELNQIIQEKEIVIIQLQHALKDSITYMTFGMENVKMAMKLDEEVKQILSK